MAATLKRPTQLQKVIHSLQHGFGATALPPSVKAIKVQVPAKHAGAGARSFVKENLPRIAYANQTLPLTVTWLPTPSSKAKTAAATATESDPSSPAPAEGQAASSATLSESPEAQAKLTIEFHDMPSQEIFFGAKPASQITREVLDLTRFTGEALASRSS